MLTLKLDHRLGPEVDDVGPAGLARQVGAGVVQGAARVDGAAACLQRLGDPVSLSENRFWLWFGCVRIDYPLSRTPEYPGLKRFDPISGDIITL